MTWLGVVVLILVVAALVAYFVFGIGRGTPPPP